MVKKKIFNKKKFKILFDCFSKNFKGALNQINTINTVNTNANIYPVLDAATIANFNRLQLLHEKF